MISGWRSFHVRILFLLTSCLLLTSCGYTTKSTLPSRLRTIQVPEFENAIDFNVTTQRNLYRPLLEIDVRNAIIDRYLFDGNLRLSNTAADADLILEGKLIDFRRDVMRFTDNDDVEEYRITITVSLVLQDVENDMPMWVEPSFSGDASYFLTGPEASSEEQAVLEAIEDLARRVVERTIEGW